MVPHSFDLFSGVGALAVACSHIFQPALFCEIDEYCIKVLMTRMRHKQLPTKVPIIPGIRQLIRMVKNKESLKSLCDVICGGFPCQDLSSLNCSRKGLDGERSGLIREVKDLTELCLPAYVVLENVGALISEKDGENGKIVINMFHEIGYDVRWMCTRSSDFGGAHHRRRVFLLFRLREAVRVSAWTGETARRHKRVRIMDKFWLNGRFAAQATNTVDLSSHRKLQSSGCMANGNWSGYAAKKHKTHAIVPRRGRFVVSRVSKHAKQKYELDKKKGERHRAPLISADRIENSSMWPTPRTRSHMVNPMITNRTCNDLGTAVAYSSCTDLGNQGGIKLIQSGVKLGPKDSYYANGRMAQAWRLDPWFAECLMHMPIGWTDYRCEHPDSSLETTVCKVVCSQNRIFMHRKNRIRTHYTMEERYFLDEQTRSTGNAVDMLQAHCSVNGLFCGVCSVAQTPLFTIE